MTVSHWYIAGCAHVKCLSPAVGSHEWWCENPVGSCQSYKTLGVSPWSPGCGWAEGSVQRLYDRVCVVDQVLWAEGADDDPPDTGGVRSVLEALGGRGGDPRFGVCRVPADMPGEQGFFHQHTDALLLGEGSDGAVSVVSGVDRQHEDIDQREGCGGPFGGFGGDADGPDLALFFQAAEGVEAGGVMEDVEVVAIGVKEGDIEVVGAEQAEGAVDGIGDGVRGEVEA